MKLSGALLLAFLLFFGRSASAASFSDSAIIISLGTASGAVLGASTLPFYEDSGKHTKNIFYGAAIGAVVGVFFAAYTGVKDGTAEDDEEARLRRQQSDDRFAFSREVSPESTSLARLSAPRGLIAWSSIASLKF